MDSVRHGPQILTLSYLSSNFIERLFLCFVAVWPAAAGLISLYTWLAPRPLVVLSVAVTAVLSIACALSRNIRIRDFRKLMSRWQLVCWITIVGVWFYGAAFVASEPRLAFGWGLFNGFLFFASACFALWLMNRGEGAIWLVLLHLGFGMALYLTFYASTLKDLLIAAGGIWIHSFYPFVNVRVFTNMLSPIAILPFFWFALGSQSSLFVKFAAWSSSVLFLGFLFWSGGRAPVLAYFSSILLICVLTPWDVARNLIWKFLVTTVPATVLSLSFPTPEASFGFWQRLFISTSPGMDSIDALTSYRVGLWRHTLDKSLEHLWFGHGLHQWAYTLPHLKEHGAAHNTPLELLFDLGLVGGLAVVVLVSGTWFRHLRHLGESSSTQIALIGMVSVAILQSPFDSILFGRHTLQLLLCGFAMLRFYSDTDSSLVRRIWTTQGGSDTCIVAHNGDVQISGGGVR